MKLPDFPWDLLSPYSQKAREYSDGAIDLSQGTPVDPTPEFIQEALKIKSNSPGYPLTIGSPEFRDAARQWAITELGVQGDFDLLPTIGSKELIAWLPTFLQSKTVIFPKIAYPTYLVGALIAGADPIPVDIDPIDWPNSDLIWLNSPSNPTGRVHTEAELLKVIEHARKTKSILASDECYLPFSDTGVKPTSILKLANGNNEGLIAVHSLSKRSNLAGYRSGLIIGDPKIIATIREIRKHSGMLMPAPIQYASSIALKDKKHVEAQAKLYSDRRRKLIPALTAAGFTIEYSNAGLYIWCSRDENCWETVKWFSELGVIVTPGEFYGEESKNFIRIALTASDENIDKVIKRISI
jgi:succinyldiaminopimelate transaminase